jgi:hypothetical protein
MINIDLTLVNINKHLVEVDEDNVLNATKKDHIISLKFKLLLCLPRSKQHCGESIRDTLLPKQVIPFPAKLFLH